MTLRSEILPHRDDRRELPRRLLARVDRHFTHIVEYTDFPNGVMTANGPYHWSLVGGTRCSLVSRGWFTPHAVRCRTETTHADRHAVKVILRSWARETSDRFLDFFLVRSSQHRPYADGETALLDIGRNASAGGAVSFVYDALPRAGMMGEDLARFGSFNQCFTAILVWDDFHLRGLIEHLNRESGRNALAEGNAPLPPVLEAARRFIRRAQERPGTIYHELSRGRP